jgi:hypothetical protein
MPSPFLWGYVWVIVPPPRWQCGRLGWLGTQGGSASTVAVSGLSPIFTGEMFGP